MSTSPAPNRPANSPDFKQGPCGRCYEVRCRTGNVLWDYNCRTCTEQLGGTLLADITPNWKDSQPTAASRATRMLARRPIRGTQIWSNSARQAPLNAAMTETKTVEAEQGFALPQGSGGGGGGRLIGRWSEATHALARRKV